MESMKKLSIFIFLFLTLLSCLEQEAVIEEVPQEGDTNSSNTVKYDGKALYETHCMNCHGTLLSSDKTDATPSEILYSINDIVRMRYLSEYLNDSQIIAISKSLSSSDPSRIHPNITSGSPTGAFIGATSSLTLQVTTDLKTNCKYDTSDLSYDQMSGTLNSDSSKKTHSKPISLSPGASYKFYVHCEDLIYGNQTKVSQLITFSTDLDVADTTPPELSITPRSEPLLGGTTKAQIYLNTNEFSSCKYSSDNTATYSQMILMESTGALGHVQTLTGLVSGNSYTFYAICEDPSGNQSIKGTLSFTIDSTISGSLLYAHSCMGCHGGLASSSKRGATSLEIKDAIRDVGRMRIQYLEFLSDEQIDAISDSL